MSHKNEHSLRSPLAKARGLGSAKSGTEHWTSQRLTALLIIPTAFYMLIGFLNNVLNGGYSAAMYWMQSPITSSIAILFLLSSLKHWDLGMQVVLEDYVSCDRSRLTLLYLVKLSAAIMAIIGTLSIAKIYLGV